jgi:hypothetical protein
VHAGGSDTLHETVTADDSDLLLPAPAARAKFVRNVASTVPESAAVAFCDALLAGEARMPLGDAWRILGDPPAAAQALD